MYHKQLLLKRKTIIIVAAYFDSIESLECETSIALTEKEYKKSIHNVYMFYINE